MDGLKKEGEMVAFAVRELVWTLRDCWQEADVPGHLREWWYVVTHREVVLGD